MCNQKFPINFKYLTSHTKTHLVAICFTCAIILSSRKSYGNIFVHVFNNRTIFSSESCSGHKFNKPPNISCGRMYKRDESRNENTNSLNELSEFGQKLLMFFLFFFFYFIAWLHQNNVISYFIVIVDPFWHQKIDKRLEWSRYNLAFMIHDSTDSHRCVLWRLIKEGIKFVFCCVGQKWSVFFVCVCFLSNLPWNQLGQIQRIPLIRQILQPFSLSLPCTWICDWTMLSRR